MTQLAMETSKEVRSWYDQLAEQGPAYGYFPAEPKKCFLIVTPQFEDEARIVFGDLGVQILNGHRFRGSVIGDCMIADDFVRKKVAMWVDCVVKLSKAATKSPQAAYTALSKSLQFEWSYLQRVMHNCGGAFVPLQDAILKAFYPALFEGDLSDVECKPFSLPTHFAGLGINNPTETASSSYHTSPKLRQKLLRDVVNLVLPVTWVQSERQDMRREKHLTRFPNRN